MGDNLKYAQIQEDNQEDNQEECMICFEKFKSYQTKVKCCFCKNICHYKCYKKFIKINSNFSSKCIQCSTRSVYFKKPYWFCFYI